MVKIHQHVKFQAIPSMRSPANARKPLRTDGRTDGRTCHKTVTDGRVDQRTHVQVKRGYFRLWTNGRTDGQPENIMPPAPKGGGIKTDGIKTVFHNRIKSRLKASRSNFNTMQQYLNVVHDTQHFHKWLFIIITTLMVQHKTAVTPLLVHWSYCSLALNHWYVWCQLYSYQNS